MVDMHPVHETKSGHFSTFTGAKVSLQSPKASSIKINDIAHALSNLCRFGGHTRYFYSVAQHSILVAKLAKLNGENREIQLAALMHDATEAYVQDLIKPLKNMVAEPYDVIEARFEAVIAQKFGIKLEHFAAVKQYDRAALEIEHEYLMVGKDRARFMQFFSSGAVDPPFAEIAFLGQFKQLIIKKSS
ncbi:MAG: HD domain-containing protein [Cyclobacteriaceae bacterium]